MMVMSACMNRLRVQVVRPVDQSLSSDPDRLLVHNCTTRMGMGSPDWNVSMVNIHLQKSLWVYCPGHAGVKGNDRADSLAIKSNPHKWLAFSEGLKC